MGILPPYILISAIPRSLGGIIGFYFLFSCQIHNVNIVSLIIYFWVLELNNVSNSIYHRYFNEWDATTVIGESENTGRGRRSDGEVLPALSCTRSAFRRSTRYYLDRQLEILINGLLEYICSFLITAPI